MAMLGHGVDELRRGRGCGGVARRLAGVRRRGCAAVLAWRRGCGRKPIRAFLARLAQRRAAAAAAFLASPSATAVIDGEGGGDGSIPQLSSVANSVVSRCSR